MGSDVGIVIIILLQTSDSRSTAAVLLLVRGLEHWRVFLSLPAPPLAFGTHLAMGSALGGFFLHASYLSPRSSVLLFMVGGRLIFFFF